MQHTLIVRHHYKLLNSFFSHIHGEWEERYGRDSMATSTNVPVFVLSKRRSLMRIHQRNETTKFVCVIVAPSTFFFNLMSFYFRRALPAPLYVIIVWPSHRLAINIVCICALHIQYTICSYRKARAGNFIFVRFKSNSPARWVPICRNTDSNTIYTILSTII